MRSTPASNTSGGLDQPIPSPPNSSPCPRPRTFYKYLSPKRTDVLQNLRIRFTPVSALNDPFESLPGIMIGDREWYVELFRKRVEREIIERAIRSPVKRKQYRRVRKKEFENFYNCYTDVSWLTKLSEDVRQMSDSVQGCLSLSATATNVLMWSHYAQNHEGYVIGFDADHEYFGKGVSPVIYSSIRPTHNPFEHRHSGAIFYTKSSDWSYEQEYRKFQSFVEPIKLENGNWLSPYRPGDASPGQKNAVVLFPIPPDSISSVILGWKSTPELHKAITRALESHQLQHVQVYAACPSPDRYEVELMPVARDEHSRIAL